jgi:predicted alpha/beta-hydrolase family hydrolase
VSSAAAGPEPVRIAWRDGEVAGAWHRPQRASPRAALVLGHGAGGDMDMTQLVSVASGLAACGISVMRFNFPYAEAGRGAPDRQDKLEACFWAAAKEASAEADRLYLGGRSLGGRIASHVTADGFPSAGLVFIAYPLHPPGKPDRLRDEHLRRITAPMLFLSGTRDPFATPSLLAATVRDLERATLRWFEGGAHSLRVPGRKDAEVTAEIVAAIDDWIGP